MHTQFSRLEKISRQQGGFYTISVKSGGLAAKNLTRRERLLYMSTLFDIHTAKHNLVVGSIRELANYVCNKDNETALEFAKQCPNLFTEISDTWYCPNAEVVFSRTENAGFYSRSNAIDGIKTGLSVVDTLRFALAKKWRISRWWLPYNQINSSTEKEEQWDTITLVIAEKVAGLIDSNDFVIGCYKALDKHYQLFQQKSYAWQDSPEENTAYKGCIEWLITDSLIGYDAMKDADWGFSKRQALKMEEVYKPLFDKVKQAHQFISPDAWRCFQYYVLKTPVQEIIEFVYGVNKTNPKLYNRARVKYYSAIHNIETWLQRAVNELSGT